MSNSISVVGYKHDGTSVPGVDVVAFGRCLRHAADEWNRVLSGMVRLVPSGRELADVSVTLGFAHAQKSDDDTRPNWRVLGSSRQRLGKPSWDIELRDDQPVIDWAAPNPTKAGIWWRRIMGIRPDARLVTSVLMHELGHVLHIPHSICPDTDWIMSPKAAMRETFHKKEAARYRQFFHDMIWTQQNE